MGRSNGFFDAKLHSAIRLTPNDRYFGWAENDLFEHSKGRMNYPDGFVRSDKQWLHFAFDDNRHRAMHHSAKLPPLKQLRDNESSSPWQRGRKRTVARRARRCMS